jgi:GAF domain-containing protein
MGQHQKQTAAEQQISSLGRILQSLREEDNVEALIETTISYIKEQFEYSLIWIALYDRLEHILFGKDGFTPGGDSTFLRQRLVLSPGDLLEQVVIEQRPLGVADLRAEHRAEEWQDLATKYGIQGTIILPIRHRDRCLGVLLLGSQRWGFSQIAEEKARLGIVLGELGIRLCHQEMELQHKQTKRLEEPLLRLLENVQTQSKLQQKLETVTHSTHEFVSPGRTNIYWFEPEGRYFWRRTSSQFLKTNLHVDKQAGGITALELSDFYYALAANQLVWIGEARSSLKSNFTLSVLQKLSVRSILAAPIICQKNLLGFLAVEAKEPRIWTENDKNYLKAAAGLISLTSPNESVEKGIKQIQSSAELNALIAQAIYSDNDVEKVLRNCGEKVVEKFGTVGFLLLQYDAEQNNYQILYQSQPQNRRGLTWTLDALKQVDWELLRQAETSVAIENLESDLRFYNWSTTLLKQGVRSLLIGNCTPGKSPSAVLVITSETNRAWTTQEKEILWGVSQQIGVVVRQWQLQTSKEQQQQILQSFQECLRNLEAAQSNENNTTNTEENYLERTALEQIAKVLDCPLAILLAWMPGQLYAQIIPGVIANNRFGIKLDSGIPILAEALIQWGLENEGVLTLKVENLPEQTRKWFHGVDIGQILVLALRTSADFQVTGVVVLADHQQRQWSEQSLNATETLVCQLAWSRRWIQVTKYLSSRTDKLQQLNWFKYRRLEEIHRTTTQLLKQLHDLGIPREELSQMRYQQLLRQLDQTTITMNALLKNENWELRFATENMPIASLLKRSLERVDNLLKQQKLWVGVHGLGQEEQDSSESNYSALPQSTLMISGDIAKIELVIYELLLWAGYRSNSGGRIDIWCRRLDEQALEVSITDNGAIDPLMLAELHEENPVDILAVSILKQLPALHLVICQRIINAMKGELSFYQLPDGRVVSRLLLQLAKSK